MGLLNSLDESAKKCAELHMDMLDKINAVVELSKKGDLDGIINITYDSRDYNELQFDKALLLIPEKTETFERFKFHILIKNTKLSLRILLM